MPIDAVVDVPARTVRMHYSRTPLFEEWKGALDRVLETPGFDKGFAFLVDRREVAAPSAEFVQKTTFYAQSNIAKLDGSRWALVVTSPASYGMGRMWQTLTNDLPIEIRLFEDIGTAELWLRTGAGGSKPLLKVVA